MRIIEILYLTFAITAVAACLPQIRHLLQGKHSREFQVATWMMWMGSQVMSTIYLSTIQAYLVAMISFAWTSFYAVMVVLILYYRRYPGGRKQLAEAPVPIDS